MKNRRGFTLVELMAVIAILAIILVIVVPKVFRSISESKKRACNIQMNYIIDAAATYFTKYRYNETDSGITYDEQYKSEDGVDITLTMLNNASLLKGTINNPVDDKELGLDTTKVNIKYNSSEEQFIYKIYVYEQETSSWEEVVCK